MNPSDRTGQEKQDIQKWTGRNRTGRTGQAEKNRWKRTYRKGQEKQERQNRKGRTGKAEQDRQNRTGR